MAGQTEWSKSTGEREFARSVKQEMPWLSSNSLLAVEFSHSKEDEQPLRDELGSVPQLSLRAAPRHSCWMSEVRFLLRGCHRRKLNLSLWCLSESFNVRVETTSSGSINADLAGLTCCGCCDSCFCWSGFFLREKIACGENFHGDSTMTLPFAAVLPATAVVSTSRCEIGSATRDIKRWCQ